MATDEIQRRGMRRVSILKRRVACRSQRIAPKHKNKPKLNVYRKISAISKIDREVNADERPVVAVWRREEAWRLSAARGGILKGRRALKAEASG